MPPTPKLQRLSEQGSGFAAFPEARIYKNPGKGTIQHLLFGDYITPPKNADGTYQEWSEDLLDESKKWLRVRSRQIEGWMKLDEVQLERTLEVNFVDIGQGDGCHLVTPADEHFVIDAGKGDNMYRFLRWRFNLAKPGSALPKFFGVISHPDEDHWGGFVPLLSRLPQEDGRQIVFEKLYHNGILQRAGSKLGKTFKGEDHHYLRDFIQDQGTLESILEEEEEKSEYQKFLAGALDNFPDLEIKTAGKGMLSNDILYKRKGLTMKVLAPVPEEQDGGLMLRWFDEKLKDIGLTKNGHSVVLQLSIGKIRLLLGGDLNSKSADYLMEHYSGKDVRSLRIKIEGASGEEKTQLQQEMQEAVNACRGHFQVEVAKSCHHGSADITNELLQSINAIATVISSGDEESFCHPRPETLGAVGKYGRGDRPLIYSTELARSSPEFLKTKEVKTDEEKQKLVATYGMITFRTDGEKAVLAQKLERDRWSFGVLTKWQIDKLIWNDERDEFISKK